MPVDYSVIKDIIGQHPAHRMDFDTLYSSIINEVNLGHIAVTKNPLNSLEIFNYTIECSFNNKWNVFSLISRGLILDPVNKQVVATTFPKFFNYGEVSYDLPNMSFSTYEKVDGSLGIIYYYNNKWNVATRGSFQSDQAKWAENWLYRNIDLDKLIIGNTYLVEIIYPENRIVVPYLFSGLVLTAIYDSVGFELIEIDNEAAYIGIFSPKIHKYDSIEELLEIAKTLPSSEEGFVIRFSNGFRIKIKGDEYCRVHRLISNVTPNRVWEMMMEGDNMDEIRKQLPEEMQKDYDTIIGIFNQKLLGIVNEASKEYEITKNMSDRDCGIFLLNNCSHNSVARNFVFPCRKMNFLTEVYKSGTGMRRKAFNWFKPKSNKLDGYVPTNAMNRFGNNDN